MVIQALWTGVRASMRLQCQVSARFGHIAGVPLVCQFGLSASRVKTRACEC